MTQRPRPDLAAFCEEQHGRVLAMLVVYVNDRQIAEELTQDTLVRACRDWDRVRLMENPSGWISTVAFNFARSWFRRQYAARRARARQQVATLEPDQPDRAGALAIRSAVSSLPRRQREAVILRFLADRTVAETAEVMGCATGTVKTHTSRGLAALRNMDLGIEIPSNDDGTSATTACGAAMTSAVPRRPRPGRHT